MKKIFTFLLAMVMFMTVANAQTIKNDGVFSHMYLGIKGGAVHNPVSNYDNFEFKNLNWNGALELGKDVTPITGFSLEGICNPDFENGFKVDRVDVFGNVKFNLMNLFGGYKGYPRRVEIKTVTGIGWNHYFDNTVEAERTVENPNDIALQAGLEFDFNLGKNRNWYITFSPMVQANQILRGNKIEFVAKGADVTADLGVAYRFGRGNKSHNFEICYKVYTEQQYADLYALYDECMNRPVQVDTIVIENTVTEVQVKNNELSNAVIVFAKNSSELTEAETHRLDIIMGGLDKEGTYMVVGSADSATGTEAYNKELAQKRANTVAEIMNKNGFNNVETATQIDALKDQEITRCAIIRVK
jgi:outer membrane protein OmpA-like peptidoglycan-associated protein